MKTYFRIISYCCILWLIPIFGIAQNTATIWEEFKANVSNMPLKPKQVIIEKKSKSMHPFKKQNEYHYYLDFSIKWNEGKGTATLIKTDVLKGAVSMEDTSKNLSPFIYPNPILTEILTGVLKNQSPLFDTIYMGINYKAFKAELNTNKKVKNSLFFISEKNHQVAFLMVSNKNEKNTDGFESNESIKFTFSKVKDRYMLIETIFLYVDKEKGLPLLRSINYNYNF